jgi:hypothetical protein
MPTAITKAILLNLGAFLADNNIRRNVSSLTYNYNSPAGNVVVNQMTVNPGETFTWNSPMSPSAVTVISTTSPLTISVTLRPSGSYATKANKLHIVDDDVGQVVLTNPSTTVPARLIIIQG